MTSITENSKVLNWKNLSMELYQLCITIMFALNHMIFCNLALQDGHPLLLLKIAQNMKTTISGPFWPLVSFLFLCFQRIFQQN